MMPQRRVFSIAVAAQGEDDGRAGPRRSRYVGTYVGQQGDFHAGSCAGRPGGFLGRGVDSPWRLHTGPCGNRAISATVRTGSRPGPTRHVGFREAREARGNQMLEPLSEATPGSLFTIPLL
jgi:hypothetical protein